jgi:uncharacterized protein (UPF0335 family)
MTTRDDATTAAAMAKAAADAATDAVERLSNQIDTLSQKLDHFADVLFPQIASMDKSLGVCQARHSEQLRQYDGRLLRVETDLEDIVPKVRLLWVVDRVRLWAARGLVGIGLTGIGGTMAYGIKYLMGW